MLMYSTFKLSNSIGPFSNLILPLPLEYKVIWGGDWPIISLRFWANVKSVQNNECLFTYAISLYGFLKFILKFKNVASPWEKFHVWYQENDWKFMNVLKKKKKEKGISEYWLKNNFRSVQIWIYLLLVWNF